MRCCRCVWPVRPMSKAWIGLIMGLLMRQGMACMPGMTLVMQRQRCISTARCVPVVAMLLGL